VTCPACGQALAIGQERCLYCGAVVAPAVEGALAPDPLASPPRGKAEPLREIPGLRKKEKTWKDEVKERIRHRRRQRAEDAGLPLFDSEEPAASPPEPAGAEAKGIPPVTRTEGGEPSTKQGHGGDHIRSLPTAPLDLPLRPPAETEFPRDSSRAGELELGGEPTREEPSLEPHREEGRPREWSLEVPAVPSEMRPVERPAFFRERAQAAAADLGLLGVLWALVVYFASRAAHVPIRGLRPAWPYLVAYMAFLGVLYGGYFGGTTGQTLGKIWVGLRVVDVAGRPAGYLRALLRTALGALGVLGAGLGLVPMLFDPARRALHDRILHTRVIKG
jgi:uncharacterized RDD family membrane protein YckC